MQFCEKLDFLMKISSTTNSSLALQVNLDASHISRLRRGKRNAVKDENCLRLMSNYFAKRCVSDHQRKALANMLDINILSFDGNNVSELIMRWLVDGKNEGTDKIETFLKDISNISVRPKISAPTNTLSVECTKAEQEIFYGIEGKRKAVECFLSEVLAKEQPQTLLLYSDEPTDWMTTDREFTAKWVSLMIRVLSKGNRIKIIHTVSRDLDEMLHAISQWMPLYMSGLIEPYYYPKKRDGIFKKTLFIAPNTSAVISSSTGNMINKAANFLIRNHSAIKVLIEEFNQYLSLCNPLMKVFTPKDKVLYINTLLKFEKEKCSSIIMTESLSLLTMPKAVALSVVTRTKDANINISELAQTRMTNFKQQLQDNSFIEIIRIFNGEKIKNGEVKIASFDMLCGAEIYYTLEEYILHLENIQYLMNTHQNFNVYLMEEPIKRRYMVYAKENTGVIVAKTSAPQIALAINESNLTAGFFDYLRTLVGEKAYRNLNRKESSDKLNEYIHRLKEIQ